MQQLVPYTVLAALVAGLAVEGLGLSPRLFGDASHGEASWPRLAGLASFGLVVLMIAAGVDTHFVPRDPTRVVARFVHLVLVVLALGFLYYAARELVRLLRELRSG